MKYLVTGGNGFIGSVLVRRLAGAGHSVRCLLRPTSDTSRIANVPFETARGDVRDLASVRAAMAGCDCTIHLAAPGGWEMDDPDVLSAVIEGGTRNVLAAAEGRREHRVVFVSSTAAVNASSTPVEFDESSPFTIDDPILAYAHAKHRAERATAEAVARGVDAVIVNPAEVYGPGDTALGTAQNLVDFATSTPVLVCDGGTSIVHVEDVVTGILAALERGRTGERYILAGENVSVRRLAGIVLDVEERPARVVQVPNGLVRGIARAAVRMRLPLPFNPHVVPYATRYWFMNSAKARRELGVSFRGARETVESTLEWLRHKGFI